MTKTELVKQTAQRAGLSQKEVAKAVKALTGTIAGALAQGEKVVLVNFGTFAVARRGDRMGRHPRTGAPIKLPAHRVPIFRPGKGLKVGL